MIEIPISPYFDRNTAKGHPDNQCAVCGKEVKHPKHFIRCFYGISAVTHIEAEKIIADEGDNGGDMGLFIVGSDCLKNHPELKPYVEDVNEHIDPTDDTPQLSAYDQLMLDRFYAPDPADSEEPQPVDYWRRELTALEQVEQRFIAAVALTTEENLRRAERFHTWRVWHEDIEQTIDRHVAMLELVRTSTECIWNDIYTARKALNDAIYAVCRETYPIGKHIAHDPFWQQAVNRADTIGIALAALAGVTEVTAEVRV